jgi:NTP pyrophosphatase (non-canonical NTP hydrolase)
MGSYDYLPVEAQQAISAFKKVGHTVKTYQGIFNTHRKTSKEELKKELFAVFNLSDYYEKEYYYTEEEIEDEKDSKAKKQMSRKKVSKLIEKIVQKEKIAENIYDVREANPSWMFIYTDIVTPTIMAGSFNNLLKLVPYKKNGGQPSGGFYNFPSLDFFPINRTNLRTIEFLIKTQSGKDYKYYAEGEINMTLLFKKIKDAL